MLCNTVLGSASEGEASGVESSRAARTPAGRGSRWRVAAVVLFALVAFGVAWELHFSTSRVAETDVFYHLFYASQYAARGPFTGLSPHVVCSAVGQSRGDIWYGFHVLLAPLTLVSDPIFRIKFAGVVVLIAALVILYLAFRRARVALPFLWPFVALFSLGLTTWRFTMVRPHVLSVALAVALCALFAEGSLAALVAVSAALSWVHLNYFWVPLVVAALAGVVHNVTYDAWPWKKMAAVAGGVVLGALLRPYPLQALKVLYVQVFRTLLERGKAGLRPPAELLPGKVGELLTGSPVFVLVALVVLVLALRAARVLKERLEGRDVIVLWSSLCLSALFLLMTVVVAERSFELCAPFAALFLATAVTGLMRLTSSRPMGRVLLGVGGAAFLGLLIVFAFPWYQNRMATAGVQPDRLRPAAQWLGANTRADDMVFNLSTDSFGELAYWGAPNRFLQGMDTFFLYAYDPQLFWKAAHLAMGTSPGRTWGTPTPLPGGDVDIVTALRRDFGAKYVLVTKPNQAALGQYLQSDARFRRSFESPKADLYTLAPQAPAL